MTTPTTPTTPAATTAPQTTASETLRESPRNGAARESPRGAAARESPCGAETTRKGLWPWEEVCRRFCPDNWAKASAHPLFCVTGDVPRVGDLDKSCGSGRALEWMLVQLRQLFKSAGYSRDAERARDLCDFAADFLADTATLRVTELMLFFSGYRSGRFGDSYAAPSPRTLGMAYRNDFLPHLRQLRRKAEDLRQQREAQKRLQRPESHPVTREEYLRCREITIHAIALRPEAIRRLKAAATGPLQGYDPSLPLPQRVAVSVLRESPLTDHIYDRQPGEPRLFEWN